MDVAGHVDRAKARIVEVLEEHHATTYPELEARISEAYDSGDQKNVDPHHVTTGRNQLLAEGALVASTERTRGSTGREVTTVRLNVAGRSTVQARTAARKRLLTARYNTWAQGSVRHPHGLIGPAGEAALRSALAASAALAPVEPGFGEASHVWGTGLRGSVDSAAYFVPIATTGLPGAPITLLFEMKNLRSWIYPSSAEIYQLLDKAARLQQAHPGQPLVPVFCCRRHHLTLVWMAHQLGFLAIEMDIQFVGDVEDDPLNEVRRELHFLDLTRGSGPSRRIRDRLRSPSVQAALPRIAAAWQQTAMGSLAPLIADARAADSGPARTAAVDALRIEASALGHQGGW